MSELPAGWLDVQLGDICSKPQYGYTTRASDKGITKFLRTTDITKGLKWASVPFCEVDPEDPNKFQLHSGDIVISRAGSIGFSALIENVEIQAVFASYLIRFRALDGIEKRYLKRFLESEAYWSQITERAAGNALQNVNAQKLSGLKIPLPPLAEQIRIAAKLDELLAQVDTLKARIDAIPALIKRFRQSVLAAAVSGHLTEEWRKSNPQKTTESMLNGFTPLPPPPRYKSRSDAFIKGVKATAIGKPTECAINAWEWVPLVQIAKMESGHTPSRATPEYWEGNIPWIGIRDARKNHEKVIFETEQKTNTLGLENSAARLLPKDTICISRTASVGYVVKMGRPMATSQDFVNWIPTKYVNPDWLKWLFVAEQKSLFRFGKGTTHTTVYFPEWLSMHIALPHIDEQREIARRVEQLLALADQLEARVKAAQARIDRLTQSILAKAFRGELVPQDPNDEPASVLLERIKAQRAAEPKAKRGRGAAKLS